jgi:DNA-binding NarL/FixJ family response regulator
VLALAEDAARAAHATAVRLGAGWLRGEIEGLAARARLALEPIGAERDQAETPEDPFGLTARERQVLALLADGATNREIGATLRSSSRSSPSTSMEIKQTPRTTGGRLHGGRDIPR